MDECQVCCEGFNKLKHKRVVCIYCDYNVCKSCCQTYLLSTEKDPHCMKCKTVWNREFVDSFCTRYFRNTEYRKHREEVLFKREQLLMPETQPEVERILSMRKLNEILRAQKQRLLELHAIHMRTEQDIINLRNHPEILTLYRNMENIYRHLEHLRQGVQSTMVEPRRFIHKCPTENCKGFLSENWYCGLCFNYFCEKCNDVKLKDHECNPDTVKTMQLIKRDSKSCPKCGILIHRTDGCAQMWCTSCHCTFNWRTGEIETGRIHNPHFIQFKRKSNTSREHGDIPCGGIPSFRELRESMASQKILQYAIVVYETERLNFYLDTRPPDNLNFRIGYMLDDMSKEDFKNILQRQEKFVDKVRDMANIYEMIIHTGGDILRQYILDPENHDHYASILQGIVDYSNEVFLNIRKRYNCNLPKNINI
jgi:hypothetical protein